MIANVGVLVRIRGQQSSEETGGREDLKISNRQSQDEPPSIEANHQVFWDKRRELGGQEPRCLMPNKSYSRIDPSIEISLRVGYPGLIDAVSQRLQREETLR